MLDKKSILKKLKTAGAKKVLIQVPEGLKPKAFEILEFLEKNGFIPILSIDPCFGACDLRDSEAKELGCDVLLHIGHSGLGIHADVPVIFEEYLLDFDPVTLIKRYNKKLESFRSIGIVTTIQYVNSLEKAKKELEKNGHEVIIPKSKRLKPGQILGCDYSAAKYAESRLDCFLFIGSGRFHPLGLAVATEKPVFFLDIEKGEITEISKERGRLEIKRQMRIEKARHAKNFGIFVSTKPGQMNLKKAFGIRDFLRKREKKAFVIVADALTHEKILGMPIEVLVNTACPRIYEDQPNFKVVILNPEDVLEL
jgi:2-(3-amino-3-carboxypropyl)histidine synthase